MRARGNNAVTIDVQQNRRLESKLEQIEYASSPSTLNESWQRLARFIQKRRARPAVASSRVKEAERRINSINLLRVAPAWKLLSQQPIMKWIFCESD